MNNVFWRQVLTPRTQSAPDRTGLGNCSRFILEPGRTGAGRHLLLTQERGKSGSTLLRLIFIRRGRTLLRRTAATTTAVGTSPLTSSYTAPLSNLSLTIATTIPSNTATVTSIATVTGTATLSLLPTDCFMDNQKANEVYDLAHSEEPIARRVREALGVIDQALDDFK